MPPTIVSPGEQAEKTPAGTQAYEAYLRSQPPKSNGNPAVHATNQQASTSQVSDPQASTSQVSIASSTPEASSSFGPFSRNTSTAAIERPPAPEPATPTRTYDNASLAPTGSSAPTNSTSTHSNGLGQAQDVTTDETGRTSTAHPRVAFPAGGELPLLEAVVSANTGGQISGVAVTLRLLAEHARISLGKPLAVPKAGRFGPGVASGNSRQDNNSFSAERAVYRLIFLATIAEHGGDHSTAYLVSLNDELKRREVPEVEDFAPVFRGFVSEGVTNVKKFLDLETQARTTLCGRLGFLRKTGINEVAAITRDRTKIQAFKAKYNGRLPSLNQQLETYVAEHPDHQLNLPTFREIEPNDPPAFSQADQHPIPAYTPPTPAKQTPATSKGAATLSTKVAVPPKQTAAQPRANTTSGAR